MLVDSSSMHATCRGTRRRVRRPVWRMKKIHTPMRSSIGNQETKMFMRSEGSSSGFASILTPYLSRSDTSQMSPGE